MEALRIGISRRRVTLRKGSSSKRVSIRHNVWDKDQWSGKGFHLLPHKDATIKQLRAIFVRLRKGLLRLCPSICEILAFTFTTTSTQLHTGTEDIYVM